jgi:hypothetical protein
MRTYVLELARASSRRVQACARSRQPANSVEMVESLSRPGRGLLLCIATPPDEGFTKPVHERGIPKGVAGPHHFG